MYGPKITRRDFLRLSALTAAGITAAACAPKTQDSQDYLDGHRAEVTTECSTGWANPGCTDRQYSKCGEPAVLRKGSTRKIVAHSELGCVQDGYVRLELIPKIYYRWFPMSDVSIE
jgi:anaerobic selenocysteine-containing dehydrogenase